MISVLVKLVEVCTLLYWCLTHDEPSGPGVGLLSAVGLPASWAKEMDNPAPKEFVTEIVKGPAIAGAATASSTFAFGGGVTTGRLRAPPIAVP